MRQLLPTALDEVDLRAAYAYPPDLDDRRWVRANMVSSLDGAAAVDGRSGATGRRAGQAGVRRAARAQPTRCIVGAGTARIEGYRALRAKDVHAEARAVSGQRPAPVLVLVSARLELDPGSALFHGGVERPSS